MVSQVVETKEKSTKDAFSMKRSGSLSFLKDVFLK